MAIASTDWDILQLLQYFGPKVFFAILCGGVIGLERELKSKAAGIKTQILICMGSALYTSVSVLISSSLAKDGHYGDPARIAAQIVTGIGFLGGGTIIQSRGTIQGLTTAATIWVVAAIGICIGIGHADIAVATSITVVLVLVLTNIFEDRVLGRSQTFACEIVVTDPDGKVRLAINQALAQNNLILDDFDFTAQGAHSVLHCKYSGHRGDHKKFILDLWSTTGVKEVRQLSSGSSVGPETIARRVLITGKVQGVTFRASTAAEALRYPGLRGFVRNLPSGEVEVVLQGSASAVDGMLEWCHQGPPQARVEQVRVWESPIDPALPYFSVK